MKQTQTKLFDFSDAGLDFSAGSKNLFPDRFKKMLSLGYNMQTVTNVVVTGNQVVLTYGGAHGYVTDRVLKIDSGPLSLINEGEFWIDSVTTNTVTFTLDDAPISVTSGFTTRIASLGYELAYETPSVHIYKFKELSESDLYLRLLFNTSTASSRNSIAPCIGKSFNSITGEINDVLALTSNASATALDTKLLKWEFGGAATTAHNNYSYSDGYSLYGQAKVIGSKYHLAFLISLGFVTNFSARINGFFPAKMIDYPSLRYPILVGELSSTAQTSSLGPNTGQLNNARAYCGNVQVSTVQPLLKALVFNTNVASSSFISSEIDMLGNEVTCSKSLDVFEVSSGQPIGVLYGILQSYHSASSTPSSNPMNSPAIITDYDYAELSLQHTISATNVSPTGYSSLVLPIEEIKL